MNPKHHNPNEKRHDRRGNEFWAHAPYNFVPLPEKVVTLDDSEMDDSEIPGHDVYKGHTGYIGCLLETRSPLYTRCAIDPEFFAKWGDKPFHELPEDQKNGLAHCFSLDDAELPVIPGSSLRGMVRTLVEIAGYGKIQPVTDQPKITFRAVAAAYDDPLSRPYKNALNDVKVGYLEKRGDAWYVHPAQRPANLGLPEKDPFLKVKDQPDLNQTIPRLIRFRQDGYRPQYHEVRFDCKFPENKRGGKKYVRVLNIGGLNSAGKYAGVLVCSGNMAESGVASSSKRKTYVLILERDRKSVSIPIPQQVIKDYIDSLTDFQRDPPFDENRGCLIEGRPIFYLEANQEVVAFGHTTNFRVPAWFVDKGKRRTATPLDFVPTNLRCPDKTDLAEAIFGYVESQKQESRPVARAGRVFFGDARFESAQNGIWISENPITPKVLGSPKPTTFQHYLVQDKSKGHDPNVKQQLAHYATSTQETTIRGHKLYWHRDKVGLNEIQEGTEKIAKAPKQHTCIKPVNSGVTFCFRIYFESLRDFELGALLWALTLPGEAGKDYCHSLGMGKPLGLGAIKITPTLYLSDRTARYTQLFAGSNWYQGEKQELDMQQFVRAFETFVLKGLDARERGQARSLKEVARIKMLLKMLEWPGPDRLLTEYMTIEPTNEYKERPVLSDPLNINEPTGSGRSTTQRSRRNRGDYRQDNRQGWRLS